ncbi:MAG: hypothetical protein GKR95_10905 [Gammaproteobacteria bacterium]|nr:hypothetical protein [Gammaproteobacteria bacterium]
MEKIWSKHKQTNHSLSELARTLPAGTAYDRVARVDGKLILKGRTKLAASVYSLGHDLRSSKWFSDVSLEVINTAVENGQSISEFQLIVIEANEA